MIRRHELSGAEWEFGRPLLPVSLRGRKRLDDRTVLNGMVWKFRTGSARRDVPERYGADAVGEIDWLGSVGSTVVRAHQHAVGARKKRGACSRALGRSRGGLTSKMHLACDSVGRPLAFTLTGGNTNDCTQLDTTRPPSPTRQPSSSHHC